MMHSSTVKSQRGNTATQRYSDPSNRGDVIRWLDGTDGRAPACAALTQWLRGQLMSAVREACEAAPPHSYTGSGRAPRLLLDHSNVLPISMLACYPGGGTRFKRHVDNSPEAPDLRAVTAVLYLNGHWREEDGGTLRIYNTGGDDPQQSTTTSSSSSSSQHIDVQPKRGTLVLFWSHRIPHEVLPASTRRFALSLWMCVDPNRQEKGWLEGRFGL